MTNKELQEEEQEVLLSIYGGDECFKVLNDTTYQYRVGDEGHFQSFLLEISWPDGYPDDAPDISLDAFYNKHISDAVKYSIVESMKTEAEQWLGSAMTYTLVEYAKENMEELMKDQVETTKEQEEEEPVSNTATGGNPEQKKKVKKEHLTKAQKRKLADRVDHKGERARGWDWVDVIKHLSKTGSQENK